MKPESIIKLILVWSGINLVLSLLWALEISFFHGIPFVETLLPTMVRVYSISSPSAFCGTYMGHVLRRRRLALRLVIVVLSSVAGALAGVLVSDFFILLWFDETVREMDGNSQSFTLVSSIISSIIISLIAATITILLEKTREYEKQLKGLTQNDLINQNQSRDTDMKTPEFVTFRTRDALNKIRIEDILYLTSMGKHTIVHTPDHDYDMPMLLKDVTAQLNGRRFLRVHKKHLVNSDKISSLRHIYAGSYQIRLCDNDDTEIPVGRKYLSQIQGLFETRGIL